MISTGAPSTHRENGWLIQTSSHNSSALVSEALDWTLVELGLGYIDLWLMHWPVGTDADGNTNLDYLEVSPTRLSHTLREDIPGV